MDSTRNAELGDFVALLQQQQARKLDVVAPAASMTAEGGLIRVAGVEPVIDDDGVTLADGLYRPTSVFDEGVAAKLGIPLAYVRRMREERPDLYDANVNGWLRGGFWHDQVLAQHGVGPVIENRPGVGADERSFLLRLFKAEEGVGPEGETLVEQAGVARAMLSDSYGLGLDNLDVLVAALDGVRKAGVDVVIDGCDLTDRRMYVRVVAEEVQALAPALLKGYRSPFTGQTGDENPTVFAGFQISNSEVGNGAFSITPRLVVQVCRNGMTMQKDAVRAVHVGAKLDAGVIRWSAETQQKNAELITAKARDAVATFLDADYMQRVIDGLTEAAGQPVEKPEETVKVVTKQLGFDEATTDAVLGHFIRGGQMTRGGVMNAITAHAQEVEDADRAADLEAAAIDALAISA